MTVHEPASAAAPAMRSARLVLVALLAAAVWASITLLLIAGRASAEELAGTDATGGQARGPMAGSNGSLAGLADGITPSHLNRQREAVVTDGGSPLPVAPAAPLPPAVPAATALTTAGSALLRAAASASPADITAFAAVLLLAAAARRAGGSLLPAAPATRFDVAPD